MPATSPSASATAVLLEGFGRTPDLVVRALGRRDAEQVWTAQGFVGRFHLPVGDREVGYGMSSDQVAEIVAPAELLTAYHQAVHDHTMEFLEGLDAADYDR